jgi:hemerythrin-like metal-binding protein
MATYVAWKPYYSVGNSSLDAEHEEILKSIDELYAVVAVGKENAKTKKLFERLFQDTLSHFQHEERIMQAAGYPEYVAHKLEHERMRQYTVESRANFSPLKAAEILGFLKDWWTGHIQSEDKSYAPYLGAGESANAQSSP